MVFERICFEGSQESCCVAGVACSDIELISRSVSKFAAHTIEIHAKVKGREMLWRHRYVIVRGTSRRDQRSTPLGPIVGRASYR